MYYKCQHSTYSTPKIEYQLQDSAPKQQALLNRSLDCAVAMGMQSFPLRSAEGIYLSRPARLSISTLRSCTEWSGAELQKSAVQHAVAKHVDIEYGAETRSSIRLQGVGIDSEGLLQDSVGVEGGK